jgi:predicted lipid-binding transport protein (Tim44 family)
MKLWTVILAGVLALGALDAEAARRLGGGGSAGRQSSSVPERPSAAPAQAAPQKQAPPAAAAPARKPWGGLLGGLAAGLGLAWLAQALGFGEAFAQFLLFGLLALVVMVAVGLVLRARRGAAAARPPSYAFQGAAAAAQAAPPRDYSPDKVGNDASARPWERSSMAFEPAKVGAYGGGTGLRAGAALEGAPGWGIPPGFDSDGFLAAARRNFVTLQDAWDRSDTAVLRSMMTDGMLGEIRSQLAERDQHKPAAPNRTEVVLLEAQLLGIEDLGAAWLASVEFSGMIREDPSAGPSPFREVWNMTKPKDGTAGWLVAGVQALQ